MTVLDASALLAFVQGEPGAEVVEAEIEDAVIGAANWSEVVQKVLSRGGDLAILKALLQSYRVQIVPVSQEDAEEAALIWSPSGGLSLGDRLCMALADRLQQPILTADRVWGEGSRIRQIR